MRSRTGSFTLGERDQVYIAAVVEYTAQADYKTFVASAATGELGVFENTVAQALVAGSGQGVTAMDPNKEVFIAIKKGPSEEQVQRSNPFKPADITLRYTPYVAPANHVVTLTTPTDAATPAKNTRFALTILDLDVRCQPFPTYLYEVQSRTGETSDQAIARLVAQINDSSAAQNKGRDRIVTAAYTASSNSLVLTAVDNSVIFKVVIPTDPTSVNFLDGSTQAVTTQGKQGSGTPSQVRVYEKMGLIEQGVQTEYVAQGLLSEDFGKPATFVGDANTYDIINFHGYHSERSKTPHARQYLQTNFAVITPLQGSNPTAELKLIFGF